LEQKLDGLQKLCSRLESEKVALDREEEEHIKKECDEQVQYYMNAFSA
jgi:hypothetical protein